MTDHAPTFLDRFWAKVDKRGPDECWPWLGAKSQKGYGVLGVTVDGRKAAIRAHRFSFLIHFGPAPTGMLVCHSCDNPQCTNPLHLFAGTAFDNMRDMVAKGRWRPAAPGRRKPRLYAPAGKLTMEQARLIRAAYAAGQTQTSIAREYRVTQTAISNVCLGKTWREAA
jgi:hypothetical protein